MSYILHRLEAPLIPLLTMNHEFNIEEINSYLHSLVDFLYNCNAQIVEQDYMLNSTGYNASSLAPLPSNFWADAISTVVTHMITITPAYTGGDVVFKIYRRATVASGTASMTWVAYRFRDGTALTNLGTATIDFTPGDINTHLTTVTLTTPSILPGDVIRLDILRDGLGGGDNLAGFVANDGVTLSFS
jgi:hypothetical protein